MFAEGWLKRLTSPNLRALSTSIHFWCPWRTVCDDQVRGGLLLRLLPGTRRSPPTHGSGQHRWCGRCLDPRPQTGPRRPSSPPTWAASSYQRALWLSPCKITVRKMITKYTLKNHRHLHTHSKRKILTWETGDEKQKWGLFS